MIKLVLPLIAFTLFFGISAQSQEPATPASSPGAWRMEITSTGGFHGLGDGGISLSSTGETSVRNLSKSCNLTLPAEKFESLNRDFLAWELRMRNTAFDRSDITRSFTLPILCCDLIQYTFQVTSGSANPGFARFSETWAQKYANDRLHTPRVILDGLFELREALLKSCVANK